MASDDGRHEQHSTYSASSAHRWSRPDGCPASAILAKLATPKPSSAAAAEGTQAHELLEKRLKDEPVLFTNYPVKAQEGTTHAFDLVQSLRGPSSGGLWVEKKWTWRVVDWLPPEDEVYGFCDAMLWEPVTCTLHVIDYKHGVHPVDVEGCRQLMQYALSYTPPGATQIARIFLHIVQPHRYDGADPVQSWEVPPEALAQYEAEARAAIESNAIYHLTGSLEGLTYRPSAENCHWCPGFGNCEAAYDKATENEVPLPDGYDLAVLASCLKHADFLEVWIKEVRALAMSQARSGAQLPGYKLVAKEKRRVFTAPDKTVIGELWKQARIAYEEAMPRTLVTPPQAIKLMQAKLKALGLPAPDIKKRVEQLAFFMDRPQSDAFDLVELSDKRPAVDARRKLFGVEPPKLPPSNESPQP